MSEADLLGRIVREAWVKYCQETNRLEGASGVVPFEQMDAWHQEADRRIGLAVAEFVKKDILRRLGGHRA